MRQVEPIKSILIQNAVAFDGSKIPTPRINANNTLVQLFPSPQPVINMSDYLFALIQKIPNILVHSDGWDVFQQFEEKLRKTSNIQKTDSNGETLVGALLNLNVERNQLPFSFMELMLTCLLNYGADPLEKYGMAQRHDLHKTLENMVLYAELMGKPYRSLTGENLLHVAAKNDPSYLLRLVAVKQRTLNIFSEFEIIQTWLQEKNAEQLTPLILLWQREFIPSKCKGRIPDFCQFAFCSTQHALQYFKIDLWDQKRMGGDLFPLIQNQLDIYQHLRAELLDPYYDQLLPKVDLEKQRRSLQEATPLSLGQRKGLRL